jgi:quercetin dioxygenase-like cupin family protein
LVPISDSASPDAARDAAHVAHRIRNGLSSRPRRASTLPVIERFEGGPPVFKKSLIIAAVVAPVVVVSAVAQQATIKRTPLQTVDFPAGYNVVSAIAEVPGGSCAGRHTHPGVESSYVMEGPIVVKIEGKPDQTFKAGESFQIPLNAVHDACGVGGQGFKVLGSYIIEKGKPLASPAP